MTARSDLESARRVAKIAVAARLTGLSTRTIRRRISDGTLTGYRLGSRAILVDLDELDGALTPIPTVGTVSR